jgi:methylenetetrahydrofolate reductase (NADPH)
VTAPDGRLARVLGSGHFAVTSEIVPPVAGAAASVRAHALALVGYVDAVNLTDNPTASAHMSPVAAARFAHECGLEPTVQLTVRDRNRLALTADLLGAWALGARNVFCLSGDPIRVGDDADAAAVADLDVQGVIGLARRLRDEGRTLAGKEVADPPRFLIGVADVPLTDPYEPARLEAKLEAGADFVMTQITYDLDGLSGWADQMRPRGLFERAHVLVGITPLRSARQARFMDERLPGVSVPKDLIAEVEAAGADGPAVGRDQAVRLIAAVRTIPGMAGVHLMAMGHDDTTRDVIEAAGLFPRPV